MRARAVYRLSIAFNVASFLVTLFVSIHLWNKSRNPIDYHINLIDSTPHFPTSSIPFVADVSLPTNIFKRSETLASASDILTVSNFPTSKPSFTLQYLYYVDGAPCARLNGRDYRVGDMHAYGRIKDIFPERIFLSDGSWIDNVIPSTSYSTPLKGISKNED